VCRISSVVFVYWYFTFNISRKKVIDITANKELMSYVVKW